MRFDIITIFPNILTSYLKEGILAQAVKKKITKVVFHDLRHFATDKHRKTDDTPFGGGPGMVMMVEPIHKAVKKIKNKKNSKVILLSPKGKKFDQKMAQEFSKLDQLVLICGRYEGVDERVVENVADEIVSVGNYVLAGGELPAMTIVEATARLVPGVLGNKESLSSETHNSNKKDYPQYTRPAELKVGLRKKWKVPEVLLSGNHAEIQKWRDENRDL
jgi:tRNA (guanine37-N1)-methyltransferase